MRSRRQSHSNPAHPVSGDMIRQEVTSSERLHTATNLTARECFCTITIIYCRNES